MTNEEFQVLVLEELKGLKAGQQGLQQEVSGIKSEISAIKSDVDRVKTAVDNIEGQTRKTATLVKHFLPGLLTLPPL